MRVYIDSEACSGHGRCYSLAPEVFEPDDAGNGVVISHDLPDDLRPQATMGVQNCPERAITIED
jgi:ferredoxin